MIIKQSEIDDAIDMACLEFGLENDPNFKEQHYSYLDQVRKVLKRFSKCGYEINKNKKNR